MTLYEYDQSFGTELLCGVDEAGRGPFAGPVYAAAVILPPGLEIEGLNDSKKLTNKKREKIFEQITQQAVCYSIASVPPDVIDSINILQATFLAMRKAVSGLSVRPKLVLIDGDKNPDGDATSASIAAASILAKVARDRYMLELDQLYPEYQFAKHKGYGTKLHSDLILKYGISPVHRQSFLKKLAAKNPCLAEINGRRGEEAAAQCLHEKGYTILARNYRAFCGEIDIIALQGNALVFAEVKTRSPGSLYAGKEAVTSKKQERILKTAYIYMKEKNLLSGTLQPRFDVLEVRLDNTGQISAIEQIENAFGG